MGVVVVARSASSTDGKVYVQDESGGPQSVIRAQCVYGGITPNCVGSKALTLLVSRGQVVNVTGKVLHVAHSGAPPSVTTLVLDESHIEVTHSIATPMAIPVATNAVPKDQIASQYRGSYVHLTDGPVLVTNTMPYEFHKACTGSTLTHYKGFEATSSAGSVLAIGLSFDQSLTECLPDPCSATLCANLIQGQYTEIKGIVEADYAGMPKQAFLEIMPTMDSDLVR